MWSINKSHKNTSRSCTQPLLASLPGNTLFPFRSVLPTLIPHHIGHWIGLFNLALQHPSSLRGTIDVMQRILPWCVDTIRTWPWDDAYIYEREQITWTKAESQTEGTFLLTSSYSLKLKQTSWDLLLQCSFKFIFLFLSKSPQTNISSRLNLGLLSDNDASRAWWLI